MATKVMQIEDVKTKADENKLFMQKCTTKGLITSLYSYIIGVVAVPLVLHGVVRHKLSFEYKMAIGALSAMGISYVAGNVSKRRCEERLKKELQARLKSLS